MSIIYPLSSISVLQLDVEHIWTLYPVKAAVSEVKPPEQAPGFEDSFRRDWTV